MLLRASIAIAILTVAAAAGAQVAPRDVIVSWNAPPECGSAADVYPILEDHLGRSLGAGDTLAVRVEVEARPGGYHARLRFADGTAERVLEGATCRSVVDAAALIMALALREASPPMPPAAASPPAPPPVFVDDEPAMARPWGAAVRLGGVGATGVMPGLGVGIAGAARLELVDWQLGVEATLWRDGDAEVPGIDGAGATISLQTVAAFGCRDVGAALLVGCVGFEAGAMSAVSFGFENVGRGREWWSAVVGRVEAALPVGHGVSIVAAADLVVPVAAPQFVLADDTEVYRARSAGLRLGVALEARVR